MTPSGPILKDIHMPPPASWWPLAPGWWILAAIVLLAAVGLAWRSWRRRLPKRRWYEARRELDTLLVNHRNDAATFAAGVSQLLRRVARLRDPATVSLRGDAWHAALHDLADGRVSTQPLEDLEHVMYQPQTVVDPPIVADAARQWLRRVLLHGGRRA